MYEHFSPNKAYRITELLDFDDLRLHIVQNTLEEIARQLETPQAPFTDFLQASRQLRDMQQRGVSRLRVEDQEILTREAFTRDFKALAGQQQVILFFDTVEKVQDLIQWRELLGILLQLEKSVIFLAGRHNDEVGERIQNLLKGSGSAHVIPLSGLSDTEARAYFTRTKPGEYLMAENKAQSDWVCQLCNGRPILLDLAVDWLSRGANLEIPKRPQKENVAKKSAPQLLAEHDKETPTQQALEELDEETLTQLKQDFERNLVQQINQLAEPENEAILDMAHVYHYFDAARHSHLHNEFSLEDSVVLLNSLRSYSFIKPQPGGGIRLHDEMRRMVGENVWPNLDRSKTRRRHISEQMVQFYDQRLESEEVEVIRQTLATEQLYHQLYASVQQGHQVFRPIFREALGRYQLGYAQLLLNTFLDFANDFNAALQSWADVHKGRLLRAEEKVQEAVDLIQPAKETLQALQVHEEMDTVCNALGYCHRLLGNWEQAISAYEEALNYSLAEHDARQMAETMNNIANVSRLSGDFERANRYSLVGLKIREKINDRKGIASSCYVRGMVTWETGNSTEAAQYLRRARQVSEEIGHVEGLADAIKYQSYLHFRTGDIDTALPLIREAKHIFADKGIGLGHADCLNLETRILIDKHAVEGESDDGFREAEELAHQALKVARRIHDNYKIAECNLTLCRIYFRWGRFYHDKDKDKAQKYYRLARQKYDHPEGGRLARQRHYLGPASVYEWVMGDIAFAAQDWETAFNHYIAECEISCRFKDARFARALNGLSDRFHTLAAFEDEGRDLARQYCDYVISQWKDRNLATDFPEVIEECEYVKGSLRLIDPQYIAHLRQWGEDLLTRGEWKKAIEIYEELLNIQQIYRPDEAVANAMNQSAWAYRQKGQFVQARRFCQQSLLIRERLGNMQLIAGSRLVMGTIMWTTGNTNEAARYFRLAQELYQKAGDEIGLARANRHSAFMRHLIGDREQAQNLAAQAEATFREQELFAELADTLNLLATMLRHEKRFEEAREKVKECHQLAEKSGAKFTLTEAWLTMGLIEYTEGRQIWEKTGELLRVKLFFDKAKACYEAGYPLAEKFDYLLLLSVYNSMAGYIAFAEGRFATAFEHFIHDLDFGARYERGRMRRELDQVVNHFVQLPQNLRRFYADYIIDEWRERGLAETEPDVARLFQLLKEYNAYV
jgi:tetratricopeptide (TPR) repeat protein